MGTIGILNVGAGDTKLVFDKNNPQETIRASRIVKDMLRRGYALLIEVEDGDKKVMRRVKEFDETKCEYIIADFDPVTAEKEDAKEQANGESSEETGTAETSDAKTSTTRTSRRGRQKTKPISAFGRSGVAVARTAGG